MPSGIRRQKLTPESAKDIATRVLARLVGEPEALGRFLAVAGLGPQNLRAAAAEPGFLTGVLDFVLADEALLLTLSERLDLPPQRIGETRDVLAGAGPGTGNGSG
jgi:hypothetical protein